MLKEIIQKIETELKTISGLKVGRYKGEFEEGVDWSPVFPIVLQRLDDWQPVQKNMQGKVMKADTRLTLYIADKDINSSAGLDVIESVISKLDGKNLTVTLTEDTSVTIKTSIDDGGLKPYAYKNGAEVYTLIILIQ